MQRQNNRRVKELDVFGADKNRIALAPAFAQHPPMLARVLSAAVNGVEAFPVEAEVNSGWGDATVVLIMSIPPILKRSFFSRKARQCKPV